MEDPSQIYKALSEHMRLRILMLLTHGELCVCDLMAVLEEPQSKVSRHLAYLRHSGFVESKRVGTWMHYFLKDRLSPLSSAQIELLKRELSGLAWAQTDTEKLRQVQGQKLCEQTGGRPSPTTGKSKARKGQRPKA
jgi:ArsR family transcriptional regulator, arsenate/arsenite/antimonite-responsive transcriptional repressor